MNRINCELCGASVPAKDDYRKREAKRLRARKLLRARQRAEFADYIYANSEGELR